jgi:hypothetical protein
MIPTDPNLSGRRRASRAYLIFSGAAQPRVCDLASQAAPAVPQVLDRARPEIGSLPINALAIAVALAAGFAHPDWRLD